MFYTLLFIKLALIFYIIKENIINENLFLEINPRSKIFY